MKVDSLLHFGLYFPKLEGTNYAPQGVVRKERLALSFAIDPFHTGLFQRHLRPSCNDSGSIFSHWPSLQKQRHLCAIADKVSFCQSETTLMNGDSWLWLAPCMVHIPAMREMIRVGWPVFFFFHLTLFDWSSSPFYQNKVIRLLAVIFLIVNCI